MSRMHEKVPKETGLQEINENMEKQGRTKKGRYFTYSYKNEGRSAIFVCGGYSSPLSSLMIHCMS